MAKVNQSKSPVKGWIWGFLAAGIAGLGYAAVLPLYKWPHYLLMAAAALLVGRVAQIMGSGLDTSKRMPAMEDMPKTGNEQVDQLIERGRGILKEIVEENRLIPDPELSRQIDEMESITNKIFRTVIEQPDKAPQIRRFMDYYLPTTLKMLRGYRKMDERKVSGQEAENVKDKIESAMDVVIGAFKKQLNTLYQNDILDISTDIDVLETMLKQDGLSGQPISMFGGAGAAAQQKKED
ncbi:MAG: 5-bromo-4-chloroindolyl phosphate hydrolysis family protein [Eubacteriales bacterium]